MTPNEIEPNKDFFGVWVMALIAVLGGAARQAHQHLTGKPVGWRHLAVRATISAFIGACCYFAFPAGERWTYPACGLLSWMGADGVSLLLQLFFKGKDK